MRWSRYPQLESTNKVTRAPLTNARFPLHRAHIRVLHLGQSGERPERYGEPLRLDTMPSSPSLHA
jgi:hypothetical protein